MAEIRRKFYNTGDAKGFTKEAFFNAVLGLLDGEDVDTSLIRAACEYELEGIASRTKTSTGEKKDALQSNYAKELAEAIVPLLGSEPQTAKDLIEKAFAAGKRPSSGSEKFAAPWVSRVLNATPGVEKVMIVVDKVDAKGLRSQAEATAYKLA